MLRVLLRAISGMLLGLLTVASLSAQEESPTFHARVLDSLVLDGDLSEWGSFTPVVFDVDALVLTDGSALSRDWKGPEDLSGEIFIGFTAADLVIAGRIRDDVYTPNPKTWYRGDEVEIFLDLDLSGREEREDVYNEDDYQILLFPLEPGLTWGVVAGNGRRGQWDGGLDGVRTAQRRLQDDAGRYRGFTFEAALPLGNFPGLTVAAGTAIGFDIALSDADGELSQKTYMTVGGRGRLSSDPRRFGRLVFDEPPAPASPRPAPAGDWLIPTLIFLSTAIILFLVWRFRRLLSPITATPVKTRLKVSATLVALLLLVYLVPLAIQAARRSSRGKEVTASAKQVSSMLAEANREWLLGTPGTGPDPERVRMLLTGGPGAPPERHEFEPLFVHEPALSETNSGTPLIDYRRVLVMGDAARFPAGGTEAAAVSLVLRLAPDPEATVPLEAGQVVGRVRFHLTSGGEVPERSLRYGQELDDGAGAAPAVGLPPDAATAWIDAATDTHSIELRIPLETPAALRELEVVSALEEGKLVIHGVTILPPGNGAPVPLALETPTRVGVPTNLYEDRPLRSGLLLQPGSEPVRVPLRQSADVVWVFFVKPPLPEDSERDPAGIDKVAFTLIDADGTRGEPVVLENGNHLDAEFLYTSRHPPEFRADLAFRWFPPGESPRHRDVIRVDAGGIHPVALEAAFLGGTEPVLLAGVTQGNRREHVVGVGLDFLNWYPEEGLYRLKPGVREEVDRLGLTWYRAGRAEWTTIGPEDRRLGIVGSTLPTGTGSDPAGGPFAPQDRRLGDERYLSVFLPVPSGGGDVLEVSLALPPDVGTSTAVSILFFVILAALLLTALLVLSDLLARIPRLRTKLTIGFAIAALVPLLIFFFGLTGVLEREIERSAVRTLEEQVGLVRAGIDEMRDEVRRRARALLEDEDLLSPLAPANREAYLERTNAVVKERAATISPFSGPGRIFVQDFVLVGEDPGPRVFPLGTRDHPFLETRESADDIASRWSELVLEGIASQPLSGGRRTIAVEVPAGRELLDDLRSRFGTRFHLLLFTMRGYPLASTLVLKGEDTPARMRERQKVIAEIDLDRSPALREEVLGRVPCSVAYDIVRTTRGEPVALVGVALQQAEFVAARAEIRNLFLILGAVILLLEVIVGNVLTRRITDPLTSLARGARDVAAGRLATRVRVESGDEIGALGDSFNRMTWELSRRIGELGKLNAAIRSLSGSLDRDLVLDRAVGAFREAVSEPDGLLLMIGHEGEAEIAAGFRGERRLPATRVPLVGGDFLSRCLELEGPEVIADLEPGAGREAGSTGTLLGASRTVAAIPFDPGRGGQGAILLLYDRPDPELTDSDLEFLSTMAQQVGIALVNAHLYKLAIEDVATGLYVHSYFAARLREETDRSVAAGRPLSLVLVTLPEAEDIYEAYGPEEGDQLMARAAVLVKVAVRGMKVLARADRTTIEVMLPEVEKEDAVLTAREIRRSLTRRGIRLAEASTRSIRLSPSIGLATCPDDAKSAEFLLAEARGALYRAVRDRKGSPAAGVSDDPGDLESRIASRGGRFIFRSEKILELLETVDRIAASDVPILIQGETGVGKEVLAELVHEKSRRAKRALVKVNSAALPDTLLESELFGYERGAFTGADKRKLGRFELAEGGTIFLDEVGEMPPQTQVKLLRVLQDHRVERLGSTAPVSVDVRVIAATNRDLLADIAAGLFREDLYFRLNVVSLVIPPLRARKEEIPVFVDHFIGLYRKEHKTIATHLGPGAMDRLFAHSWPGNVRELRNTIERALVIARGEEIRPDEIVFPDPSRTESPASKPREAPAEATPAAHAGLNERQHRLMEILATRGSITTRDFADLVGVSARTGNRDLKELIDRGLIVQIGRRRAAVYRLA